MGPARTWSFVGASLLAIGSGIALVVLVLGYAVIANVTSMVPLSLAAGLTLMGMATFVATRRNRRAKPSRLAAEAAWYFVISASAYTGAGYLFAF